MLRLPRAHFAVALALGLALVAAASCRRPRFPPRGDAAAVVVVAPRRDAAPPPRVAEQEPNDTAEQAQILAINPEWPLVVLEGNLSASTDVKGKDVDVFKLPVPGGQAEAPAAGPATDAGRAAEDPRAVARRLSVEVTAEDGTGLSLQVLEETGKVMEGITIDSGETGGMPNLAVSPGRAYYIRIKTNPKAGKTAKLEPAAVCKYRLTVQLGDFDIADEREPNDSRELANPMGVVGTAEWSGYYGWPRDQDYFRIILPEVPSAMDVDLDAVEGVAPSLQVLDEAGARRASARGRKGERLTLRNVVLPPASPDAGPPPHYVYLVVRADSGSNRFRRYVLRVVMGAPKANFEVEPNDTPSEAMPINDGTITGYLPVGDIDFFRYEGRGPRDVTVEVTFPARVRGMVTVFRPGTVEPVANAEAKKPRQTVTLPAIPSLGQPLVLRISQAKADGNANDPYTLRIASATSSPPPSGAATPAAPAPVQ